MTVRRLRSQEAQHVESGVVLGSLDRGTMSLELGENAMTVPVDRGLDRTCYILPATPRWDDGEPVPPELAVQLQSIIAEIARFWGQEPEFEIHN